MALIAAAWSSRGGTVAFVNPTGNLPVYDGNPPGLLSLGMDFDVTAPIRITSLGAYDYLQDGIFSHDVTVGVFARDSGQLIGQPSTFTTADPGSLIQGSRFKSLASPILLPAGFRGSIVAFGYCSILGYAGGERFVDEYNSNPPRQSTSGGGLLTFSASRYVGASSLFYATNIDLSFAHPDYSTNQYMAGTFVFESSGTATNFARPFIRPAVEICWPTAAGVTYQVQWVPEVDTNNWQNLGAPVIGGGVTNCVSDPLGNSQQRLYRVLTLQ